MPSLPGAVRDLINRQLVASERLMSEIEADLDSYRELTTRQQDQLVRALDKQMRCIASVSHELRLVRRQEERDAEALTFEQRRALFLEWVASLPPEHRADLLAGLAGIMPAARPPKEQ